MNASSLQLVLLALVVLPGSLVAVLLMRANPRLAPVLWAFVMCFVPYWLGLTIKVYLPPTTLVAALLLVALLPAARLRWSYVDLLPALLVLLFLLAVVAGTADSASGFVLVAEWIPAYVVGRVMAASVDLRYTYAVTALALAAAAVLALVEFRTGVNPFVLVSANNSQYAVWGPLQLRGGVLRAEGAFGQSIPLGAALALGVPFAIGSRLPSWVKFALVGVLLAGTVVTLSRIGMASAVLGLVLCAIFLRDALTRRARILFLVLLAVTVAAALPLLARVFTQAGAEATDSAAYRGGLLTTIGSMNPFGIATSFQRTATGDVYFAGFKSIDSALIYLGLNLGVVAMLVAVAGLGAAVVVVLLRRASAATIAVVAQLPALTSVALITQYASFFWFVAGLAATSQLLLHPRRRHAVGAAAHDPVPDRVPLAVES